MKRISVIFATLLLLPGLAAAEGEMPLQHADNDLTNQASLQRGAKDFVNYCAGCHSLQYERWRRLGADLKLTDQQLEQNLMFAQSKVTDMMVSAMPEKQAADWFGKAPPDLSLVARYRGPDWIFTYLKSFYLDDSRPTGTNNILLPNAAMPDILWKEQGLQKAVYKEVTDADGNKHKVFDHFEAVTKGEMDQKQFDGMVRDITNFLDYVGEPVQVERHNMGIKVILFLVVFFLFAYMLKREVWRDVH